MPKDLKKIVWLVSYPKSGNTWFRIFLENLLTDSKEPVDINRLRSTQIASSRALIDRELGVSSADLTNAEIEELRPKVYYQIARKSEELVFLKVHEAWKQTASGRPIFPKEITKAALYFVRNPLDIVISFSYHSSKPIEQTINDMNDREFSFCGDSKKLYNQVRQLLSDWSEHVSSWIDESGLPILILKYEDMLANTNFVFNQALNYIGLDFEVDKVERAINYSSFNLLQQMEIKKGFIEKPSNMLSFFRKGEVDSWKSNLNTSMVNKIVSHHLPLMKRLCYIET